MLDDTLVTSFMSGFYGYGSYAADYWFVGMEEGGAISAQEIVDHLEHWDRRGRNELEDLRDFHVTKGNKTYFTGAPKLQGTWSRLVRIVLGVEGAEASVAEVKAYQANSLGRQHGSTCLLELLPLPSPTTGHWLYADLSSLSVLIDRATYREHVVEPRAKHIRDLVTSHRPRAVIFYGVDHWYMSWWQRIAGAEFHKGSLDGRAIYTAGDAGTTFVIMKHPVSRGLTNRYLQQIGELLARSNGHAHSGA